MNVTFDSRRSAALEAALNEMVVTDTDPVRVRRAHRKAWLIGGMIATGAVLSVGASAIVIGVPGWTALPSQDSSASPSYAPIPNWPTNAKGQTYGTQGSSPVMPNLLEVQGTDANGEPVNGYILSEQLEEAENGGPRPTSPTQALKQQEERLRNYPNGQWLPLYKDDGETQIGRFIVAPGN